MQLVKKEGSISKSAVGFIIIFISREDIFIAQISSYKKFIEILTFA